VLASALAGNAAAWITFWNTSHAQNAWAAGGAVFATTAGLMIGLVTFLHPKDGN
jgi:hypothetical protein